MTTKLRAVHYLNQFFGRIGAEDKAHTPPLKKDGPVGPGRLFQQMLAPDAEIVGTVICGDNYFGEHIEAAKADVVNLIKSYEPDFLIAGPAFNAGRYGVACGAVCEAATEQLAVSAVTGMFSENPGVELYKKATYIIETKPSTIGMKEAAEKMTALVLKLARGNPIGSPGQEGYLPRGIRKNYFAAQNGAKRAVQMLLQKLQGTRFETEYPMPVFDRAEPLPPLRQLKTTKMALVTSGGIVPRGNPDRIESSGASKYQKYDISNIDQLTSQGYEAVHGGYDPTFANADPNRVLPLDVVRDLEREGVVGKIYPYYYATVGNGTTVSNAIKFARKIAQDLLCEGVNAVIISSTWGSCTRCGATLAKELERAGILSVHICTIVPISQTVGANRIVPAVAIPHPLGDPTKSESEEKLLRRSLIEKALAAMKTKIEDQTVF